MTRMRLVWIVAWVVAAVTAAAWTGRDLQRTRLEGGLRRPVLALELAGSPAHADRAVLENARPPGAPDLPVTERMKQEGMQAHLRFDRGFILVYTLLFSFFGGLLARRAGGGRRWLAAAGIACAVATGWLDFVENDHIRSFMAAAGGSPGRDALVDALRAASLRKWAAFFATLVLLGASLVRAGGPPAAVGRLYLLAAALGAVGVTCALGLPGHLAGIEWSLTLVLAGAAPALVAMWTVWRRGKCESA